MVATNDVHYLERSDAETQATLMCIQMNTMVSDGRPLGFETDEFYYKSTEEMERLFCAYLSRRHSPPQRRSKFLFHSFLSTYLVGNPI